MLLRVMLILYRSRRLDASLDIRIGEAFVDDTMHNNVTIRIILVLFHDISLNDEAADTIALMRLFRFVLFCSKVT